MLCPSCEGPVCLGCGRGCFAVLKPFHAPCAECGTPTGFNKTATGKPQCDGCFAKARGAPVAHTVQRA
jgi:hypothetical protein